MLPKTIAPIRTSNGNIKSKFLSNIIGIKSIAPAGGKLILTLLIAINKTMQAESAHKKSGKPKYIFKTNLKIHPASAPKNIRITI